MFAYRYDPWNRLVEVRKAYLDAGGDVQANLVIATMAYDGLGRRILKATTNNGLHRAASYHFYYDGYRIVETRNGDEQVLKQQVWGLQYVDELVQIAINQDPEDSSETTCERFFWTLADASFNILGVINKAGHLVERFEYTPYGQRVSYSHPWFRADMNQDGSIDPADYSYWSSQYNIALGGGDPDPAADANGDGSVDPADYIYWTGAYNEVLSSGTPAGDDPLVFHATLTTHYSDEVISATAATPLCEFGHQGLMHDEALGLVYNRARMWSLQVGRFNQTDPIGYPDGMNAFAGYHILWGGVDPFGESAASALHAAETAITEAVAESVQYIMDNEHLLKNPSDDGWFGKQLDAQLSSRVDGKQFSPGLLEKNATTRTGVLVNKFTGEIRAFGASRGTDHLVQVDVVYFPDRTKAQIGQIMPDDAITYELKAAAALRPRSDQLERLRSLPGKLKLTRSTHRWSRAAGAIIPAKGSHGIRALTAVGYIGTVCGLVSIAITSETEAAMLDEMDAAVENWQRYVDQGRNAMGTHKEGARQRVANAIYNYLHSGTDGNGSVGAYYGLIMTYLGADGDQ